MLDDHAGNRLFADSRIDFAGGLLGFLGGEVDEVVDRSVGADLNHGLIPTPLPFQLGFTGLTPINLSILLQRLVAFRQRSKCTTSNESVRFTSGRVIEKVTEAASEQTVASVTAFRSNVF
eukprot:640868-Hanusia_phi.AAC.1